MKTKIIALAILSVLLLAGCASKVEVVKNEYAAAFQKTTQQAGVVTLDVRTPGEFSQGHISGAINIDVEGPNFATEISKLNKATSYAVYCHSGRRSAIATEIMKKSQFKSLFNLQDGIQSWLASGLALTTA